MVQRCEHPQENWLCLCCKDVLCSRFVNKHMLEHYQQKQHNLALSYRFFSFSSSASLFPKWESLSFLALMMIDLCWFSDLSVWCFSCDAYLDAQVIQPLRAPYETAYILKFGSPPPFRLQIDEKEEANTSTHN